MKKNLAKLKKEERQFIKAWCDLHKIKDCTVVRDNCDYVRFNDLGSYFWFPNKFHGLKANHKYKLNELISEEELKKGGKNVKEN